VQTHPGTGYTVFQNTVGDPTTDRCRWLKRGKRLWKAFLKNVSESWLRSPLAMVLPDVWPAPVLVNRWATEMAAIQKEGSDE